MPIVWSLLGLTSTPGQAIKFNGTQGGNYPELAHVASLVGSLPLGCCRGVMVEQREPDEQKAHTEMHTNTNTNTHADKTDADMGV